MTSDIARLMIIVDGDHPGDPDLQQVDAFAAGLGARIIVVTASDHTPSLYFVSGAVAANLLQENTKRMRERLAAAERRCGQALRQSITFRSAIDLPIDVVVREARAADLLVCFARRDPPPFSDVEAGELVLKSGRPVLVIPEAAKWRSPERILIGWKDSREARRAVFDATPFLRRARKVSVVEIVENEESPEAAKVRLRDLASWLKMHSIEASTQAITPRRDTIEVFAEAVREFNPDWIVAGAYGRSRLGEWIFGGFTRHLLTGSDRPAFLSH